MGLLSVDISTSGAKAILFSENGEIIASSYQEYQPIYPKPGWGELDPEALWAALRKTVRQVASKHQGQIKAMAVACMGNNTLLVREDGTALGNAILAFDNRASEEVALIRDTIPEKEYYQIRGSRPRTMSNLSQVLWLKRNRPDTFRQTWKIMTFLDFVIMRLGFPGVIDYSMVSSSTPFDIRKKEHSERLLGPFGLSRRMFSDPFPAGHLLGELGPAVRAQLGLPRGVRLVVGGHDAYCAILGAGVSTDNPDLVADITGTVEAVIYISREPILSQEAFDLGLKSHCGILSGTYATGIDLSTAGALVRWFRDELAPEERMKARKEKVSAYDLMFAPLNFDGGSIMVLPHFAGNAADYKAKGAIVGLTIGTSRQELLKGIVEGITHELKLNLDRLEVAARTPLNVIRSFGGHTKSPKWLQLKADVTGRTVEAVQVEEATALGAALLAGVATGVWDSIEQAIKATLKIKGTYQPRPEIHRIYQRQHEVYKRLRGLMPPINAELYHLPGGEKPR